MKQDIKEDLYQAYGYVPNEAEGERWTVYEEVLIVIHPERRPKIFTRGCAGSYYEIEPSFGRYP